MFVPVCSVAQFSTNYRFPFLNMSPTFPLCAAKKLIYDIRDKYFLHSA